MYIPRSGRGSADETSWENSYLYNWHRAPRAIVAILFEINFTGLIKSLCKGSLFNGEYSDCTPIYIHLLTSTFSLFSYFSYFLENLRLTIQIQTVPLVNKSIKQSKRCVTTRGVTRRCRLCWLTNSALIYEPKGGEGVGCKVSANEHSCGRGAQINFGHLTPYLTYGYYSVLDVLPWPS
jgi:hypothetical protein